MYSQIYDVVLIFMGKKWSDQRAAKVIIERIAKIKISLPSRTNFRTGFKGYESTFEAGFDSLVTLLNGLVNYDSRVPEEQRGIILSKAIFESADKARIIAAAVEKEITKFESEYLSLPLQDYELITGLSIVGINNRKIKTDNASIIITKHFPKKIKSHYDFSAVKRLYPRLNDNSYSWVLVSVKARCEHAAATQALNELDYVRGIFNLYSCYRSSRMSFSLPAPINKICRYPYHSLHSPSGHRTSDYYWFDNNYSDRVSAFDVSSKFDDIKKFYIHTSKQIMATNQKTYFKGILSMFCNALDNSDMNNSFMSLWALLESLTRTKEKTYDVTIRRLLFNFKDKELMNIKLEEFRKRRNQAVHTNREVNDAEYCAHELMNIATEYILFCINAYQKVSSHEEFAAVIDCPTDKVRLYKEITTKQQELSHLETVEKLIHVN